MIYPFVQGQTYRRRDVYRIIGISEDTKGGNWETGYSRHNEDWFIFCNVGVPGQSGHDYPNAFVDNDLVWYGKTGSHLQQPSIQSMLSPVGEVYIFARENSRAAFTFLGRGRAKSTADNDPVMIIWSFAKDKEKQPLLLPEEVSDPSKYIEGAVKQITVNSYERNHAARQKCIEHYGAVCVVCGFSFKAVYGDIGEGFIHVHHLKPLAEVGESYELDPIADLRPVCPNCHAMLHRKTPPFSIEELQRQFFNKE